MRAWSKELPAYTRELAAVYTRRYPDDSSGWVVLADVLATMACYADAKAALRRAQRLVPRRFEASIMVQWGHLYNNACNLKRAESWYRRAVAKRACTSNLIYLGGVLAKQGKFREAKRCHQRAVKIADGAVDQAEWNLGAILRAQRRFPEALKHFKHALELDPGDKIARDAIRDLNKLLAKSTA
jgi:tetratricopeptide (TPR) repeat protein